MTICGCSALPVTNVVTSNTDNGARNSYYEKISQEQMDNSLLFGWGMPAVLVVALIVAQCRLCIVNC